MILDIDITTGLKLIFDTCKMIGFKENGNNIEVFGWSDVIVSTKLTLDNYRQANIDDKNIFHIVPAMKLFNVGDKIKIENNMLYSDYFNYIGLEYEPLNISNYEVKLGKSTDNKLLYKCISSMYTFDKDTENNIVFNKHRTILSNASALVEVETENEVDVSIPFILVKQYLSDCSIIVDNDVTYLCNKNYSINVGKQELNEIDFPSDLIEVYSSLSLRPFSNQIFITLKDIFNSCLLILEDNTVVPMLETTNVKVNCEMKASSIIKVPVKIIKLIYDLFESSSEISISSKDNVIMIHSGKISLIFGGSIVE